MMRLDHFVVNIDNDESLLEPLKANLSFAGFPFEPSYGKGTKGFKVANIWIGDQYFELVRLKRRDGGGWRTEWVKRYNQGQRGLVGLMLSTSQLDEIRKALTARGIRCSEPERISFRWLFFKKTLPWRTVYLEPIPGTDIQLCFLELDSPSVMDRFRPYMTPNSRDHGITGITRAALKCRLGEDAFNFLQRIFPEAQRQGNRLVQSLGEQELSFEGTSGPLARLYLDAASTNPALIGKTVEIENVSVTTVYRRCS